MLLTYPFDMFRTRLAYQVQAHEYWRVKDIFSHLKGEGSKSRLPFPSLMIGLYNGIFPTLCGIFVYAGVTFMTYESLKKRFITMPTTVNSESKSRKFICGATAGAIGQTFAYPLDFIRRRIQLSPVAKNLPQVKGTLPTILSVFKIEGGFLKGLQRLFTGLSINYLKVAPATGISFVVYETMKEILQIK